MQFDGFTKQDFQTFQIEGLDDRMAAIKERIQPKFSSLGSALAEDVAAFAGNEMHLHIAKHARRTKNPPKDTWLAIAHDKRGYKKHPHFQLGLFDDHVFLWLAYIYEMPDKEKAAKTFLESSEDILSQLPDSYLISPDHMKKDDLPLTKENLISTLERFRDVKKGEFLLGRKIYSDDPMLKNGEKVYQFAKETYQTLMPMYKMSMQ
ncbi:YktB family protein [Bacillus marinisedimentorum]|uniref:YktB family protein n=1 Tax=Bacillus marinisedimentorum TaxID=1821260 RepID=UPI0007E0F5EB|nr:DUF1054 domain-containing protein [Bacillus marinisedimentorum]